MTFETDYITDYYTIMVFGKTTKGSNIVTLSSMEGVYKERIVNISDSDENFNILSIDYKNNNIVLDRNMENTGSKIMFTIR